MVAIRVRYHQIGSAGLSCPCRSCTSSTTAAGTPAHAMISTDSTRSLCGASPRLAAELAGCPLCWWCASGHLERAVETAGGQEAFDAAVTAMLEDNRGWRLAEMRKRRGMTQEQVAVRMGVSVARISQIESGDVSTQDVLNRFITALGGTLKLIADFGDEQLKIA